MTARSRKNHGMVTVEAAVIMPLLAVFMLVLVWLLSLGITQVRVVDAARDGARAAARGENGQTAQEAARQSAPDGAQVRISEHGDMVTVTVQVDAEPPGWLLVPLPGVGIDATSTMEVEGSARAQ